MAYAWPQKLQQTEPQTFKQDSADQFKKIGSENFLVRNHNFLCWEFW